jgi:hypothetical protein
LSSIQEGKESEIRDGEISLQWKRNAIGKSAVFRNSIGRLIPTRRCSSGGEPLSSPRNRSENRTRTRSPSSAFYRKELRRSPATPLCQPAIEPYDDDRPIRPGKAKLRLSRRISWGFNPKSANLIKASTRRMYFVPEGKYNRSQARSACESVPRRNRPVGDGMIGRPNS